MPGGRHRHGRATLRGGPGVAELHFQSLMTCGQAPLTAPKWRVSFGNSVVVGSGQTGFPGRSRLTASSRSTSCSKAPNGITRGRLGSLQSPVLGPTVTSLVEEQLEANSLRREAR